MRKINKILITALTSPKHSSLVSELLYAVIYPAILYSATALSCIMNPLCSVLF